MNTQFEIKFYTLFSLIATPCVSDPITGGPMLATTGDYGFDFDDEELGQEIPAPLPANVADLPAPDITAEEFDSLYKWFIS
jgi:hypothetical protein